MAAVAPPPFQSKLDIWGSGQTATHSLDSKEQMTNILPYQYPSQQHGTDMNLPPSGYMTADYSVMGPSVGMDEGPLSPKNKGENPNLRRSFSTPIGVAPAGMEQTQTDHSSLSEKKRNKLGYHRTSVACGHCRRRKIRCIPSTSDVQGRCINCIRLKKECSFYPVDQQPATEGRKHSVSRSSVGSPTPSLLPHTKPKLGRPSSSKRLERLPKPDPNGRRPQDAQELTKTSIQTMGPPSMKSHGSDAYLPDPKMSANTSSRSFEYNHSHGASTNWMSPETNPGSTKPGDLNATWRSYPQESSIAPAFSPYTPHTTNQTAPTWTTQTDGPRDDLGWSYPPATPRSLSFSTDGMGGHQTPYPSMVHGMAERPYDRKAGSVSGMYQTPITTTIPGVDSIPGTTMGGHVSLMTDAAGAQSYASWQPQYSYGKPGDAGAAYTGWSAEHGATVDPTSSSGMYYPSR